MQDELKHPKKKRLRKESDADEGASFAALAKFTSSDMIRQVKAGMHVIAPMDVEMEEPIAPDDPTL